MEALIRLLTAKKLLDASQPELDRIKKEAGTTIEKGDVQIYKSSLYRRGDILYMIARIAGQKALVLVSETPITTELTGEAFQVNSFHCLRANLDVENSLALHKIFSFTAPISLRDKRTTIGCGDRLGLATPGQLRAIANYDVYPVLAQQSIRELSLTRRDYACVVRDATFLVFQEGYERGYGADGDHLKTLTDIDVALAAGMPMITLDLTEVMKPEPAAWNIERVETEFEKLDDSIVQHVLPKYAEKTFKLSGSTIHFDTLEVKRCSLMYWDALEFTKEVDDHLREKRGDEYDFEVSIDETAAATLPSHHLFIASELQLRGVAVNSLAPRFVGGFQKGIDYVGKVQEFDEQFKVHCDISRAYGNYKISIHSGSDKFSVYPSIGKYTDYRLHLKTAGTSWLEAVRVIARTNPPLFRTMLTMALDFFPEAAKLYQVSTNLDAVRDPSEVADQDLPDYLDDINARQLLHITYGGLLNAAEIREEFFRTLDEHEKEHYAAVECNMRKHLELLGVKTI